MRVRHTPINCLQGPKPHLHPKHIAGTNFCSGDFVFGTFRRRFIFSIKLTDMAYNEALADRIKDILESKRIRYTEKKMFGGLCFLVDDKMLLGVEKNRLMTRIDPEDEITALKKKGAKPMDFTGRIMKGFLFVDDTAVDKDGELEYWVDLCMKYNPKAKSKAKAKSEVKAKN